MTYFLQRASTLLMHCIVQLGFDVDPENYNLIRKTSGSKIIEIRLSDNDFSGSSMSVNFYGDDQGGFIDSDKLLDLVAKLNATDEDLWLTNHFAWDYNFNRETEKYELLLSFRINRLNKDDLFTDAGLMVLPLFFMSSLATVSLVSEMAHKSKLKPTKDILAVSKILPIPQELSSSS